MPETTESQTVHVAAPSGDSQTEHIYESAESEPDDEFWLDQGRQMLTESLASARSAAAALTTGLGALQGIYLGILGLAKFIPENIELWKKALFITPSLLWMIALYHCLQVMMTKALEVRLDSPTDVRDRTTELLREKQRYLELAFWWLFGGLLAAVLLVIFRLKM